MMSNIFSFLVCVEDFLEVFIEDDCINFPSLLFTLVCRIPFKFPESPKSLPKTGLSKFFTYFVYR